MNRRALIAAFVVCLGAAALALAAPAPPPEERETAPVVTGLDHVPVAVADLGAAAERYRRLGFTLKPGRPHDNGIENRHVKFADGTEIELITAPEARDSLTAEYVQHLAGGDGPAFLALYAPDLDRLARRLDAASKPHSRSRATLSFPDADPLGYVFFGPRNASPTDLPGHFEHANGADSLIAVWLAGDDLSAERELLAMVGATFSEAEVRVPDVARAAVARLEEGEVILLPGSRQLVPGRRIVGVTLRTKSLSAARDALTASGLAVPPPVATADGSSIFLAPALTHGIWLEFRELRGVVPTPAEEAVTTAEAELRRLTQELVDAVAPGRTEVWERLLDERIVHVDENGIVRDRAALLRELRPLPAGLVGSIEVDRFEVELHGETAVAAVELQERLLYHGQELHTRFRSVDTWRRSGEGWRLIGQHVAAVLRDPPAVALTAEELCAYSGVYSLTPAITTTVRCEGDGLIAIREDRPEIRYLPEVRDVFFASGQPRSRRIFTRDAAGRVNGFVDRREGEDIRWIRTADLPEA